MKTVVVDSWAVMAWIKNEQPAADEVRRLMEDAQAGTVQLLFSTINAGEVFYVLAKRHSRDKALWFKRRLPSLPLILIAPDTDTIWDAADLKSRYGMSYADAFAAALALSRKAELLTGDPDFKPVENLRISWLTRN